MSSATPQFISSFERREREKGEGRRREREREKEIALVAQSSVHLVSPVHGDEEEGDRKMKKRTVCLVLFVDRAIRIMCLLQQTEKAIF